MSESASSVILMGAGVPRDTATKLGQPLLTYHLRNARGVRYTLGWGVDSTMHGAAHTFVVGSVRCY